MTKQDTRIARMPGVLLDERVAELWMGWRWEQGTWIPPEPWMAMDHPPPYTRRIDYAWELMQRIACAVREETRPELLPAARVFFGSFHAADLFMLDKEQAARRICEMAYAAWESGKALQQEKEGDHE